MAVERKPLLLSPLSLALSAALLLAACSGTKALDAGVDAPDAGTSIGGAGDASAPDAEPLPCLQDQGGRAARGCEPGEVCNLAMSPATCVPGVACDTDVECDACSALSSPKACGHGFHLVAFCDKRHAAPGSGKAGTCTRSRAPCEACESDVDCGRNHPVLGGQASACLSYGNGGKYCGRSCLGGCPEGFTCGAEGQCRRAQCEPEIVVCPARTGMTGACAGTDQICRGEPCPGTGGARCSTNNQPGALGICIGFCETNADCPAATPICNPGNGLCGTGCAKGSCAAGETCYADGMCHPECTTNADCESTQGAGSYCNLLGQPPPRIYKPYHDTRSCQPLGCESSADCASSGRVCDKSATPPACIEGCYAHDDCAAGEVCKAPSSDTPTRARLPRETCRALADHTGMASAGVCCNPGCTDRNLQCGINEFCCGEVGSPFEAPGSCPSITATITRPASPGECFDMPAPDPWCHVCMSPDDCSSGYTRGFNVDPGVNQGRPFQEQEWCLGIAQGLGVCSVTCNPQLEDTQCPRGWSCRPFTPGCLADADCGGLECIGADTTRDPPRPGKCKCGAGGIAAVACPSSYAQLGTPVLNPRCVALGGASQDMVCVASYHCEPPGLSQSSSGESNYPAACGF